MPSRSTTNADVFPLLLNGGLVRYSLRAYRHAMSTVTRIRSAAPLTERVSEEVRALMGRHKVSQGVIAHWLGVNQTAVSARLRGTTGWKVSEIEAVAAGFGVHPAVLMGVNAELPRPDGPDGGEVLVRHQGLEPRTRWFDGSALELVA